MGFFDSLLKAPLQAAQGAATGAAAKAAAQKTAAQATSAQAAAAANNVVNQQVSQGQQTAYNAYDTAQYYTQPSQPSYTPQPTYGGSSSGSSGDSSGGNSSGGSSTPAARPAAPVAPAPAPPPPPPPPPDYGAMVSPYVDKWGNALTNDTAGTDAYAAAARQINNRVAHASDGTQEQITKAYADALNKAGNSLAARDLYRTGAINTDITPVDPATAPPQMETIIIPDAKSDSLYKRQSGDLAQQLADYQGEQQLANSQYDSQYANVLRKMGWGGEGKGWDQSPTSGAYGEATNDNVDDFVGRGLGYSGLLSQGQAQIDKKFNDQKNDVDQQAQQFDDTQTRSLTSYKNKNDSAIAQALQDAITRITQQYGVYRGQVKVGSNNSITREKSA